MQKSKVISDIKALIKEAQEDGKRQIKYPISRLRYNLLQNSLKALGFDVSFVEKKDESYALIKL